MKIHEIRIGDRIGKLVVKELILEKNKNSSTNSYCRIYKCLCDCGNYVYVAHKLLSSKHKKSCGCLKAEITRQKSIIHNIKHKNLLYVWRTMKQRCCCVTNRDYRLYGGRGITVCEEWKNDFFTFNEWAENNGYKKGLMLDRIDNNGNYEPSNCRWATSEEQANNKRTNKYITINGDTKTLSQWCKHFSVPKTKIASRLSLGWSVEETFGLVTHEKKKVVRKIKRKKVLQYTLSGSFIREWDSAYEAAEHLNCVPRYIMKSCCGEQKTHFGFIWKYKE